MGAECKVNDPPRSKSIHTTPAGQTGFSLPRQNFLGFVSNPRAHHSIRRLGCSTCQGVELKHAHAPMGDRHRAARKPGTCHAA